MYLGSMQSLVWALGTRPSPQSAANAEDANSPIKKGAWKNFIDLNDIDGNF